MKEKKNKNINTLTGIMIIILIIVIIGLFIYILYKPKKASDTHNNSDTQNGSDINNSVIEDNDDDNDNKDNMIISDHITNNKVQEIYDVVKIEKFSVASYPNYEQGGFLNDLHNKIVIAMENKGNLRFMDYSDDQLTYMNNVAYNKYYQQANLDLNKGYVSLDELNNQLNKIFNITISKADLFNIKYQYMDLYFEFGFNTMYVYDEYINGIIPLEGRGGGDTGHYVTKIYNYMENDSKAIVDTVIAYSVFCEDRNLNPLGCIYKTYKLWYHLAENNIKPLYENIDENSFEFTEENMGKFIKLRYTFNKRDDGTYYFANVEAID